MRNIFLLILSAVIFQSCGVYSFRGNNPPEGIKTIAVPLFTDNSGFAESGLKEQFTDQLKNKIISDNTLKLVDKTVADGVITCTISSVRDDALVISSNENVTKRKITIVVNVIFENLKKQKKIWDRNYENWGEYNSSTNSFSERTTGITTARDKITDDILNDIISNW
ncbi:MAG: LPS assembly lipoprotein LptE [Bacteroidetes bacterium]|nr:LPS assembly lipoprotein LptE [Bacteroidota bacterium]